MNRKTRAIACIHHGVLGCHVARYNSTDIAEREIQSVAKVAKGIPVFRREGRTTMARIAHNMTHASIHMDSCVEGMGSREQALILMIAIQAYLDMVRYRKSLSKTLAEGIHREVNFEVEQQHRYSVVFFLHPWEPSGKSYGAYLFSLIGKESLFRNLQKAVRCLEAEIKTIERQLDMRLLCPS